MRYPEDYELRSVTTQADWDSYHRIRRMVLFEARGRLGVYDANHPDDRNHEHHPLLLVFGVKSSEPSDSIVMPVVPEANAALRSIVRRDTGEKYEEFLTRLERERAAWRRRLESSAVATFASTSLTPSFAKIAVAAAKRAESKDQVSQVIVLNVSRAFPSVDLGGYGSLLVVPLCYPSLVPT